jgi:CRP/FNR family cyclic AMP-dependent transcriptional regulator
MRHKHDGRIEQLRQVALFQACTQSELRELASITTEIDATAGTVLCRQGEVGRECYIVIEGEATVTIGDADIDTVGPGGFFGEMALLDGGPRVATVTAASAMRLLVLSRPEFTQLLYDVPSVSAKLLAGVGARLREAQAQLHPTSPFGV